MISERPARGDAGQSIAASSLPSRYPSLFASAALNRCVRIRRASSWRCSRRRRGHRAGPGRWRSRHRRRRAAGLALPWAGHRRLPLTDRRAGPEASGESVTSSVRSIGILGEELSQLVRVERPFPFLSAPRERVRVDRKLLGRELVVLPSRDVVLGFVILLEQKPGRPKRRLSRDQLETGGNAVKPRPSVGRSSNDAAASAGLL